MNGKDGGDGDDSIGYGKPPMHTRFKPGQSGNVKGRPRGSNKFDHDYEEGAEPESNYQRKWSPKENHNA